MARNITVGASNAATSGTYIIGGSNGSGTATLSGVTTLNQSLTIAQANGGTLSLSGTIASGSTGTQVLTVNDIGTVTQASTGVIGGGTGTIALTKANGGTLTLAGTNTYTGTTTVNGGTLSLTGSLASTDLAVGGGTFAYSKAGTNAQSFNTTTINQGSSVINNTVATDTLALGTITRNVGGTVDFVTTTGTTTTGAATDDGSGILGPWAVIGTGLTLNYAVPSSAGTKVAAYAGGTALTTAGGGTATTNFTLPSGTLTLGASSPVTANTLQALNSGTGAIVLANGGNNITLNGILNSGSTGSNLTVSGAGTLNIGATNELVIFTANGMTISSVIANNGNTPSSLTLSGGGTLGLNGANTYSGNTYLNAGSINPNNNAAFGTSTVYLGSAGSAAGVSVVPGNSFTYANNFVVEPGGTRQLYTSGGANPTYSGVFTLVGGATLAAGPNANTGMTFGTAGVTSLTGTGNVAYGDPQAGRNSNETQRGNINLVGTVSNDVPNSFGFGGHQGGNVTLSGTISGITALAANDPNGAMVLTQPNTYTGDTTVSAGTLNLQNSLSAQNSVVNLTGGNLTFGTNTTTAITAVTLGGLSGSGNVNLDNFLSFPTAVNLTIGNSNVANAGAPSPNTLNPVYSGVLGDVNGSASVTKVGTNTQTFSGASTYTGTTTVTAGTLIVSGSLNGTTAVSVTGGTLQLAANNALNVLAPISLGGGTLQTLANQTQNFADLTVASGSSTLTLGSTGSILKFADSSADTWTGTLAITNWNGASVGGGSDQIFIGSSADLTPQQLASITFVNGTLDGNPYTTDGAMQLSNGEIVAIASVPEPATWGMMLSGVGMLALLRRRRPTVKI